MSKVQILLSKPLVVNMGKDKDGQQINLNLPQGLQEVDQGVAEHWFVKHHSQEITQDVVVNHELQEAYNKLKEEFDALQTQSDAATKKIADLEKQAKADAKEIAELKQKIADASSADNSKDADPKAEDKKAK
ncbi:STY1053 family phage-associated protein [Acinetobacter johnsonii]|uniref:STY1053 family phage-associated protein n=1 Tax=Acinetobacter johnsonii TaxID=40214 RepID=UPI0032B5ABC7